MVFKRFAGAAVWMSFVFVAAFGCEKPEHIAHYTVAKPPPIEPARNPRPGAVADEPLGEPKDRTLAAIVPLESQGWFFKLTGPKDAVAAQHDPFMTFLKSVRFSTEGKPQWTLPAGWQ